MVHSRKNREAQARAAAVSPLGSMTSSGGDRDRRGCGGTWAFSCSVWGGVAAGTGTGTRRYCCADGGVVGTSCLLEGEERYGVVRWNGKNKMNHESAGKIDEIHNQGAVPRLFVHDPV